MIKKRKSANGFMWKYAKDYNLNKLYKNDLEQIDEQIKLKEQELNKLNIQKQYLIKKLFD